MRNWRLIAEAKRNPANPDVKGVPRRRVLELFPQAKVSILRKVTLPLAALYQAIVGDLGVAVTMTVRAEGRTLRTSARRSSSITPSTISGSPRASARSVFASSGTARTT